VISAKTLPYIENALDEYLNKLVERTKSSASAGNNDACKLAEAVIRNLMNVLYGYNLQLEHRINASGFDLIDADNHVLVQVTNNCTSVKVEECLRTTYERVVNEPHLENYTLYIALLSLDNKHISTLRKKTANRLRISDSGDERKLQQYSFPVTGFHFNPHSNIINLGTFLQFLQVGENATGRPLTESQLQGLTEILDKFCIPMSLSGDICQLPPERRLSKIVTNKGSPTDSIDFSLLKACTTRISASSLTSNQWESIRHLHILGNTSSAKPFSQKESSCYIDISGTWMLVLDAAPHEIREILSLCRCSSL
jgi:hypothetical protein